MIKAGEALVDGQGHSIEHGNPKVPSLLPERGAMLLQSFKVRALLGTLLISKRTPAVRAGFILQRKIERVILKISPSWGFSAQHSQFRIKLAHSNTPYE